jgi:hypothetical protein
MSAWPMLRLARLASRLCIFEIYLQGLREKIGLCALAVKRREIRFIDRLLLLPAHDGEWTNCMGAIIARFGARNYRYGSHWNAEDPKSIKPSPPFSVEQTWVRNFHLDAVDLGQWKDFDHYTRSISSNIRRDLAKAIKEGTVSIQTRHGWSALRNIITLIVVRRHVMQKNGRPFSLLADALVHLGKIALFGKRACIVTVSQASTKYAALFCIEFGDCLYYVSGGVLPNEIGLGSFIMVKTIERWQAAHPQGRFVMGYVIGQKRPEEYTEGALLYRRKLRVTSRLGSEFVVTLKQGAAGGPRSSSPDKQSAAWRASGIG